MLAGGIVEPGGGSAGAVLAFVAVRAGLGSRMFRLEGPANAPSVSELEGATTIDLARMQLEVQRSLQPTVDEIAALGGHAAITRPSPGWVCDQVQAHLDASAESAPD